MFVRRIMVGISFCVVTLMVACGGGSGSDEVPTSTETAPTVAPASQTFTSDDGALTLEIPEGAVDDATEINIATVSAEQLPEPLSTVRGVGTGYRLEPDGLAFSEPIIATLVIPKSELDGEPENGVSAYALVTQGESGELELLSGQSTEWTIGEDKVILRGELEHFSFLSRTQGSLRLKLFPANVRHALNATFEVSSEIENGDTSQRATLRAANGEFREKLSNIGVIGSRVFGPEDLSPGETLRGSATYQCSDEESSDTYYVKALATSVVNAKETFLTVFVYADVECTDALPTQTPTPSATPVPALHLGCDHRIPGRESDVIIRIGQRRPGETVTGRMTGSGVVGDGTFTATADENGVAEARVVIDDLATYTVTVNGDTDTITVGPVCGDGDDEDDD